MRTVTSFVFLAAFLALAGTASPKTPSYTWADIDCRQSRIVAWSGLKCRATNVVTGDGNIGVFRQWTAFGTGRDGYYVHMFLWAAQNGFSYLAADETTADFVKWMFEHGKSVTEISPVARYGDADYVTFKDGKHARRCIGFRRLGTWQDHHRQRHRPLHRQCAASAGRELTPLRRRRRLRRASRALDLTSDEFHVQKKSHRPNPLADLARLGTEGDP